MRRVAVRSGSARCMSPSSRVLRSPPPDPKGCAGGALHVPDKRGGSGRGGLPPLASKQRVPGGGRQGARVQEAVVEAAQVERGALQALAALPELDQQVLAVEV